MFSEHRKLLDFDGLEEDIVRNRTMFYLVAVCVAIGALAGVPARAGLDEWTSLGPYGGPISALAIDPQTPTTLYAGTPAGGVYKSLDGGAHWSAASDGLTDVRVRALAIDPQTPATLYAVTQASGVYKSLDGGAHWTAANQGIDGVGGFPPTLGVVTLAIDPQNPATLYAGRTSGLGVFKSTDGGGQWSAASNGLPEGNPGGLGEVVRALAIDPQTPGTLYAGTFQSGVYKSTDGGNQWDATNDGLGDLVILTLAIDPLAPGTLYAGTRDGGVFKSADGGTSWLAMNEGMIASSVFSLAIDPQTLGTLYAGGVEGVFRSVDGGRVVERRGRGATRQASPPPWRSIRRPPAPSTPERQMAECSRAPTAARRGASQPRG